MKVLFVSSGNSKTFEMSPFIKAQGESLEKQDVAIKYFTLNDKGLSGYFKGVFHLRKYLSENPVDIIHAHYTLSGWVSLLALTGKPIVLSLMGDDAQGTYVGPNKLAFKSRYLTILTLLIQPFLKVVISKNSNMNQCVYRKNISHVIPNGIQLENFNTPSISFRKELGLKEETKYVLFLGNKESINKNYALAKYAIQKFLNYPNVELLAPYPVPHEEVAKYLYSVDLLVHPSFMEGSPNLVKEAMACNCPVVATDVGDIRWLFGEIDGYYIASFSPRDFAEKIKLGLDYSDKHGRTNGRERIITLGLDADTVTKKIIAIYEKVLN